MVLQGIMDGILWQVIWHEARTRTTASRGSSWRWHLDMQVQGLVYPPCNSIVIEAAQRYHIWLYKINGT